MSREGAEPIASYALLSDCQGAALVSRDGSIDWACLPRFDSPSTFGALLGEEAGHWRVAPPAETEPAVERAYVPGTLVLRTVFATGSGQLQVLDALALGQDESGHEIGRCSPHVLLRVVEGLDGEVPVDVELLPRPEYGLIVPHLVPHAGGLRSVGGAQSFVLSKPPSLSLTVTAGGAHAQMRVRAGERVRFALQVGDPWGPPEILTDGEIDELLQVAIDGWRSWSDLHENYEGPYADLVNHSGRVLQGLTYAPTSAVVAAPTTSLPEELGGVRNWDYRYCWVRDTSLTLEAQWVAACPDEAVDFFTFFATVASRTADSGVDLQVLYGIGGEHDLSERTLDHLAGYAGSRPVRVGNGAFDQLQLDVYGELLDAAAVLADQLGEVDGHLAQFLVALADTAAARWSEPDQSIWEVRGGPRHFLYSKLMCWVALDRAIRLADRLRAKDRIEGWAKVREEIRAAILTDGWSEEAGAYVQAFGHHDLDAATLKLAITGFLPADDPRMAATIEAVATRLTDERGFVYRYHSDDGLDGGEGTFLICTFWLVRCLALAGRTLEARELFERIASYGNDVGLFAEEIDPATGELLGNFPQAFTHVGLIGAAWAITQAEGDSDARQ